MAQPPKRPSRLSRRFLLQLGAATAAGSLLPASFQRVMAAPPPDGGLDSVGHVVIFMQENRSFDHYFGTMKGVRGFGDTTALRRRSGTGTVLEQPRGTDPMLADQPTVLPFLARDAVNLNNKNIEYLASLPHSWGDGAAAVARGWYDQWVPAKGAGCMAGYDRRDIAFQFELAEKFTVCDSYFCSITAGTSPNRNYLVSGHSGYEPGTRRRAVDNAAYHPDHPGYEWPTYPERLSAGGVSWRVLQEWDNFTDNNLEYFVTFKKVERAALGKLPAGMRFTTMEQFYAEVRDPGTTATRRQQLLDALDAAVAELTPADRELFERALRRGPTGSLAQQFREAVQGGTLPKVTYLVASPEDCEHPAVSSPAESSNIVYDILQVLGDHPDTWRKTVFLLNYDEFDGYFDHVPPPRPPAELADEYYQGHPMGLGPRVPMIVVSPWSFGGWVCSEVFDHTSVIKLLETWTGVPSQEITGWRRDTVGDLTAALNLTGEPAPTLGSVPTPAPVPPNVGRWTAAPPPDQDVPPVEPGISPARPLPYRLDADVTVAADGAKLALRNSGTRPAPIAVYDYTRPGAPPLSLNVLGEKEISLPTNAGTVDLTILGPNRFRRDLHQRGTGLTVSTSADHARRHLTLTVANTSDRSIELRLTDAAKRGAAGAVRTMRIAAGRQLRWVVDAADLGGWYDLLLQAPRWRYWATGQLNGGGSSVTSPFSIDGRYQIPTR